MKNRTLLIILSALVMANVLVQLCFFRLDLTSDKRYSLSCASKALVKGLDERVEVRILLDGRMNSSFLRLQSSTKELLDELGVYADLHYETRAPESSEKGIVEQLSPTIIHEKSQGGQTIQTALYPYAIVSMRGRSTVVPLLKNNRGLSGEENVNLSIEQLEFAFAEALSSLRQTEVTKIAFLEGHGELDEPYVYDLSMALSKYFQVDRGVLTGDVEDLLAYRALIVADPQLPFSEADKYQLDQYVMRGGRILWVVDGVRFSEDILSTEGFTPVLALDLRLQDLLFCYGVRVSPTLLQDMQCLPIPVDVSVGDEQPNFQPMPWYYAPLLLTSQASAVSKNLMQVSSTFCSGLEFVGERDSLRKEVLLATSSASRAIGVPSEVDLSLVQLNPELFSYAHIPVGASLEGRFRSLFAHRMKPEGVTDTLPQVKESAPTKQVIIASGSVIRNEVQQGSIIPLGYDRYTGMQFANKDFLVNALLYLTDDEGLISLRNKELALRLLNDKRAHEMRTTVQLLVILLPLLLLGMTGVIFLFIRKKRNQR